MWPSFTSGILMTRIPSIIDGRISLRVLEDDARDLMDENQGASWAPSDAGAFSTRERFGNTVGTMAGGHHVQTTTQQQQGGVPSERQVRDATLDSIRALMLIRSYRVRGHLKGENA